MLVLKTSAVSTRSGLSTLKRDPLLSGDNGGVRFLFDTAFPFSYPKQAAPDTGDAIVDISEHGNGSFVEASGQTVSFAGGGFDFSTVTGVGAVDIRNYVKGPAAWNGIFTDQKWLVCMYVKLPADADWQQTSIFQLFNSSSASYQTLPDPVLISMFKSGSNYRIEARQQTAINAYTAASLDISDAANRGSVVQISMWCDRVNTTLRIRGPGGTQIYSTAAPALNTADFSAATPQFGAVPSGLGSNTGSLNQRKFRLYRGWLENLQLSGRDPVAVLDADYERTIARGVFS